MILEGVNGIESMEEHEGGRGGDAGKFKTSRGFFDEATGFAPGGSFLVRFEKARFATGELRLGKVRRRTGDWLRLR